jgi:LCP family protein required for cell wall assembly
MHTVVYRVDKHKRRITRRLKLALLLVGFVVTCLGAGAFWGYTVLKGLYSDVSGPDVPSVKPGERINILFLGLDGGTTATGKRINVRSDAASTRTDTMILASIDPDTHKVGIIWIPRDTRTKIPGRTGYEKIAHAHAYGGPKLAMSTVSDLLTVDVHYYVRTDFEGFSHLVDILGGVQMHIDRDMFYEDPYQALKINLKAGDQVLDGNKALQFVRFRNYATADIGRVEAQQAFARAVMSKLVRVGTILKLPALAKEALNWVDTNIEPSRVLSIANIARQIEEPDIQIATLPGAAQDIRDRGELLSYWVLDEEASRRTVDVLARGIDRKVNAGLRVEVLDGSNRPQVAQAAAKVLSDAGFVVTRVAPADRKDYQVTEIVNRRVESEVAKNVARALGNGAPSSKILTKPLRDDLVDVTVIIGRDCTLK